MNPFGANRSEYPDSVEPTGRIFLSTFSATFVFKTNQKSSEKTGLPDPCPEDQRLPQAGPFLSAQGAPFAAYWKKEGSATTVGQSTSRLLPTVCCTTLFSKNL